MPEANRAHANFSEAECFSPAAAVLSLARSGALPASGSKPANPPPESAAPDNAAAGTHHSHSFILGRAVRHSILKTVGDAARQRPFGMRKEAKPAGKDMGFAASRPLARHSGLLSRSCPSIRPLAPRFLWTPPRGDVPALH